MKDTNPQHDTVFKIQQNLLLLSIVTDERMKCVAAGHPADQSRVGGQRNHRVPLNSTCTLSHHNVLVVLGAIVTEQRVRRRIKISGLKKYLDSTCNNKIKITIIIMQLVTKKMLIN